MSYDVNKKLLADFKINFENINRTNIKITEQLEKRAAFSEECAKILLNQNENIDFSFFMSLIENEKSKFNFSTLKKNIIDENILLCEYIFKAINFADLVSAYSVYIDANSQEFDENINLTINLNEKFVFNDFMQYIALFNFEIINLNYDGINNTVIIKIKDKQNVFAVFCGLLEYFGVNILNNC